MGAVSKEAKEKQAKAHAEIYMMYKEHGICPRCRKAWAEPGRVQCKNCMKKVNARQKKRDPTGEIRKENCKERRRRLKAAGLCTDCGIRQAVVGKARCHECEAKAKESRIAYNIKMRMKRELEKERARANGR